MDGKAHSEGRRLLYDGAIRSNDHWFEKFHKMLASRDLLQNTLIILVSDHGEHLGERDAGAQTARLYSEHSCASRHGVSKKLPAGKRIKTPVQLIDIMPTILDIVGINKNELVLQAIPADADRWIQPGFWVSASAFLKKSLIGVTNSTTGLLDRSLSATGTC